MSRPDGDRSSDAARSRRAAALDVETMRGIIERSGRAGIAAMGDANDE